MAQCVCACSSRLHIKVSNLLTSKLSLVFRSVDISSFRFASCLLLKFVVVLDFGAHIIHTILIIVSNYYFIVNKIVSNSNHACQLSKHKYTPNNSLWV